MVSTRPNVRSQHLANDNNATTRRARVQRSALRVQQELRARGKEAARSIRQLKEQERVVVVEVPKWAQQCEQLEAQGEALSSGPDIQMMRWARLLLTC